MTCRRAQSVVTRKPPASTKWRICATPLRPSLPGQLMKTTWEGDRLIRSSWAALTRVKGMSRARRTSWTRSYSQSYSPLSTMTMTSAWLSSCNCRSSIGMVPPHFLPKSPLGCPAIINFGPDEAISIRLENRQDFCRLLMPSLTGACRPLQGILTFS